MKYEKIPKLCTLGFIVFFLFLLMSLNVDAIDNTSIKFWLTMDDDDTSGNTFYDLSANDLDGTFVGTGNGYPGLASNTSESFNLDGNNDKIEIADNALFDIGANDFAFGFWIQANYSGNTEMLFYQDHSGGEYFQAYINSGGGGKVTFYLSESGTADLCRFDFPKTTITDNNPHLYVIMRNGTACSVSGAGQDIFVFYDGYNSETLTIHTAGTITSFVPNSAFHIGIDGSETSDFPGIIDEFFWYDRALSQTELEELYNGGDGIEPPFVAGGPAPPTLTVNSNLANTQDINEESLLFTYNGTYTNTGDLFNCTLLIDDVVNMTDSNVNLSLLQDFNWSYGEVEVNVSVNISCENVDISDATGDYYYAIDTINPVIELMSPLNLNNSIYDENDILTMKFNFSDTNLFAYNISILDSGGAVWNGENYFGSGLTGTYYENETTRTLTTIDDYTVRVMAWDDHNPVTKPVKDLHWYDDREDLFAEDFTFEGDFKFGDKFTYFYLEDNKYKLKLTFNEDLSVHEMNVSATGNLQYRLNSDYKGHFVYLPKSRYIDFEGENIKNVNVYLYDNKYGLEIELYEASDEIELESIGDLNELILDYSFTVVDPSIVYLIEINQTTHNIEDNMVTKGEIMIFVAFLPLVIGFLLFLGSSILGDEHDIMRMFLFVLGLITPLISFQYAIEVIDYYENSFTNIVADIGVHSMVVAVIFVVVLIYFVIYSAIKIIKHIAEKKQERLSY